MHQQHVEDSLELRQLTETTSLTQHHHLFSSTTLEELNTKLNVNLTELFANSALDEQAIKNEILKHITPLIKSSPRQALAIDTIIFFTGFSASVAVSPVVNSMGNLSGPLKNLLVASPSILGSLLQPFVGVAIDKTGGKKLITALRIISLAGTASLTLLIATQDITNVNAFDWRYAGIFLCNFFAGTNIAIFPLLSNAMYWFPPEKAGQVQSIYAGIGGSSLASALLFLHFSLQSIGLTGALSIFLAMSLVGAITTGFALQEPPYHQLLKLHLSHEAAKEVATLIGQKKFPISPKVSYLKDFLNLFKEQRTYALALAVYSSSGGFISSSINMYITLINILKLEVGDAVAITAAGSLWSTMVRTMTGPVLDKCDTSGGVYTLLIGSLLSLSGALMLAIPRPLPSLGYALAAKFIMDAGFGIGGTATFRTLATWSNPKNQALKPYNIGTMSSLIGAIGATAGTLLPLFTALLVAFQDENGYLNSFYLTAGLSFSAGLACWKVHSVVKDDTPRQPALAQESQSYWGSAVSFFRNMTPSWFSHTTGAQQLLAPPDNRP